LPVTRFDGSFHCDPNTSNNHLARTIITHYANIDNAICQKPACSRQIVGDEPAKFAKNTKKTAWRKAKTR